MVYTKEFLSKLYWMMKRIRLREESLVDPITNGDISCPVHLYSGQEAIADRSLCKPEKDSLHILVIKYSHGHYLAKGGSMKTMIC